MTKATTYLVDSDVFITAKNLIPTERYTREDAQRAIDGVRFSVSVAGTTIAPDRE